MNVLRRRRGGGRGGGLGRKAGGKGEGCNLWEVFAAFQGCVVVLTAGWQPGAAGQSRWERGFRQKILICRNYVFEGKKNICANLIKLCKVFSSAPG